MTELAWSLGIDWTNVLFFLTGACGASIGLLFAWGIATAAGRETPDTEDPIIEAFDHGYKAGLEDGKRVVGYGPVGSYAHACGKAWVVPEDAYCGGCGGGITWPVESERSVHP